MNNQRRHSDRGQDVADVDVASHLQNRPGCCWAGAQPQVLAPPSFEPIIVCEARRPSVNLRGTAPLTLDDIEEVTVLLGSRAPWVVGAAQPFGVGAVKHEGPDALGASRG